MNYLKIAETILRNQGEFFKEIAEHIEISYKIKAMALSSLVFLAVYGIMMGASHSFLQALSSFIKLPVLFLVTLLITTPSLHIFYSLFGARQTLSQTIAILLTAISTTILLLQGFAPFTLFFLVTSNHYHFFKLLNVGFFTVSGFLGVRFLQQGIAAIAQAESAEGNPQRKITFIIWILLYGFVGAQMAWTLAPFLGNPAREFILISNDGGNFFMDVLSASWALLGF